MIAILYECLLRPSHSDPHASPDGYVHLVDDGVLGGVGGLGARPRYLQWVCTYIGEV